jgi:hypothetical protein
VMLARRVLARMIRVEDEDGASSAAH